MNKSLLKIFLKNPLNNRAMTLTELIVATAVIGIAMLGIFAVDYAIRSTRSSSSQSSVNVMQTAAAMMRITQAASETTGKRSFSVDPIDQANEEGVLLRETPTEETICFRHDADKDPNHFTGDKWRCFQQYLLEVPPNAKTFDLWQCSQDEITAATFDCSTDTANFVISLSAKAQYIIQRDTDGRIEHISVKLSSRPDRSQSVNVMNNPDYSLTSHISPPALSQ